MMRKGLFLFSFFCLLNISIIHAQRTYVLISGVSRYQDESKNLNQSTKDAKAFCKVMENLTKDVSILTSQYANSDNILQTLRAICKGAKSKDRILFFFSGHGFPGGIATYDGYIWYKEIVEILSQSASKTKVCFFNACHSGSVAQDLKNAKFDKDMIINGKVMFFMSSRAEEYSWSVDWMSNSYFVNALVKGIRGKADKNHNKRVTVAELFDYIYKDVVRKTRKGTVQHPQLIAPENSDNIIVVDWN